MYKGRGREGKEKGKEREGRERGGRGTPGLPNVESWLHNCTVLGQAEIPKQLSRSMVNDKCCQLT